MSNQEEEPICLVKVFGYDIGLVVRCTGCPMGCEMKGDNDNGRDSSIRNNSSGSADNGSDLEGMSSEDKTEKRGLWLEQYGYFHNESGNHRYTKWICSECGKRYKPVEKCPQCGAVMEIKGL